LTEEERELAIERLGSAAPKMTDKTFVKKDFFDTVFNLHFWIFALMSVKSALGKRIVVRLVLTMFFFWRI
jgi:hypothetical protein